VVDTEGEPLPDCAADALPPNGEGEEAAGPLRAAVPEADPLASPVAVALSGEPRAEALPSLAEGEPLARALCVPDAERLPECEPEGDADGLRVARGLPVLDSGCEGRAELEGVSDGSGDADELELALGDCEEEGELEPPAPADAEALPEGLAEPAAEEVAVADGHGEDVVRALMEGSGVVEGGAGKDFAGVGVCVAPVLEAVTEADAVGGAVALTRVPEAAADALELRQAPAVPEMHAVALGLPATEVVRDAAGPPLAGLDSVADGLLVSNSAVGLPLRYGAGVPLPRGVVLVEGGALSE